MRSLRRQPLLMVAVLIATLRAASAGDSFPFGTDLMLDVAPMRGSKRVPILQIDENGNASIDLWCSSLKGQAVVGDDTIAITMGPFEPAPCTTERQAADDALLAQLGQVTHWRVDGEVVELSGGATLRFRRMTN